MYKKVLAVGMLVNVRPFIYLNCGPRQSCNRASSHWWPQWAFHGLHIRRLIIIAEAKYKLRYQPHPHLNTCNINRRPFGAILRFALPRTDIIHSVSEMSGNHIRGLDTFNQARWSSCGRMEIRRRRNVDLVDYQLNDRVDIFWCYLVWCLVQANKRKK